MEGGKERRWGEEGCAGGRNEGRREGKNKGRKERTEEVGSNRERGMK